MRKIHLINKGDSIEKIKRELSVSDGIKASEDKILGFNYVEIEKGLDDVIVVNNYLTNYLYKVKKNENALDIMSRGFSLNIIREIEEGDLLILSKPRSIRYIVKPLENIDNIAKNFGVKKDDIIDMNNLKTEKLFVGQILWI